MAPLPGDRVHRLIVQVGSLVLVASACFLIAGPLMIPDYPVLGSLFGVAVPLAFQRTIVVLLGAVYLIEGMLLFGFSRLGWWLSMIVGTIMLASSVLSAPRFWHTLLDLICVYYLYHIRSLFTGRP